jgi:vacuolar-type H+-ATPase subunit I/STV1
LSSNSSHYDEVLEELRQRGQKLANQYVVELYTILRDEEKLPPEDCRSKIEHDCLDLWSRATIRKYLPPEAKDARKQKAGKIGGENKKKAILQVAQSENGARTNLAENVSISQNEEESRSFHNELNQQLSSRTLSPELLEANKIIADKDQRIEELKKDKEELLEKQQQQHHLTRINSALLFLPYKLAMEIYDNITEAAAAASASTAIAGFDIEHDGEQVTAIYAVKIDTLPSSPASSYDKGTTSSV